MADNVTTGTNAPRRRCRHHDSMRGDGWLDDHCLLCGTDGYWEGGLRVVDAEVHPSGKLLLRRADAMLPEPDSAEDTPQRTRPWWKFWEDRT